MTSDHDDDRDFNIRVGERLRAIRNQKRLSLNDVEAESADEFKASVMGAYERGERAVSLPRLQRLAAFYGVPVEQLLPRDSDAPRDSSPNKIAIDLVALAARDGEQFAMLARFLGMIQVRRGDFNGKVLTVRADDVRAIAAMLDVPVESVPERLGELDLLFRPGT